MNTNTSVLRGKQRRFCETGSFVVMWMNLESSTQSDASQKNKYHILAILYVESRKMVLMQDRDRDADRMHTRMQVG